MQKRDSDDRNRAVAPAVAAKDAVILDNSGLNVEESADAVIRLVEEKVGKQ